MLRFLLGILFCASFLNATDVYYKIGAHDFIVSDIEPNQEVSQDASHTPGVDIGLIILNQFDENNKVQGILDIYFDYQIDEELDDDHIPVYFEYLVEYDSIFYRFASHATISWGMHIENKQNTVSSIEQEMNNYLTLNYRYHTQTLTLDLTLGTGTHYMEIDDDVPLERGYSRDDLENSSTSFISQLSLAYLQQNFNVEIKGRYISTYYCDPLRSDIAFLYSMKNLDFLPEDGVLTLKYRYTQYNWDRFQEEEFTQSVLPWDNDSMLQLYATLPFEL